MMANASWNSYIADYLESLTVERNVSPYTVRNYRQWLGRFTSWIQRQKNYISTKNLTLTDLRKYRVYLSGLTDNKGKTLSVPTQGYHLIALRAFLKWLSKNDVETLAADKIDLPKAESRRLTFLTREQVERLLSQPGISDEMELRDKAILELLFSTGLRVSELAKLDRNQIDFNSREIGVIGKGRRARVVFLSERAVQWLKRYLAMRQDRWQPVFIRYTGKKPEVVSKDGEKMRFTARGIQRVVERYRRKAGLAQKITPHGLRHSFATDLLRAGAGLREVQEMLGHKNVATTQIYTHVTNPQLKRVHDQYHGKR
ncbi:MAG: tyrosine-type recombinase/integrase [Candidatus Chisholmbacteria bacterium]|nr:tyrosine-type recombinase/integrase [Candidatus Chisholmbacteria bacterium]